MTEQTLGPYRIVQKLAAGGMGEVFLCDDPRLGRRVALKRVGGDWNDTDTGRDRLRREARAAAALNHPRIAAVYDVLETDLGPHLVMEYIEGETLSAVLRRESLTLERALQVALELTDAVTAAHAAGIVHRDLKPSNVMIGRDGHVKVLDFGLAKLRDVEQVGASLTGSGMSLGTPGYSAPEQLLGQKSDHRSDIYSLGAILYEMCSGRPAFEGADATAFAMAITTRITPPSHWNPSVPQPVDELICRALSPVPEKRPQSIHEVRTVLAAAFAATGDARTTSAADAASGPRRRGLRWAAAALVAVLAGVAVFLQWGTDREPVFPRAGAQGPVVAVLPLESLSPNPENQYIAEGIADSLITDLAGLPGLTVLSRSAVREASPADVVRAARQLGASHVVGGTVQHAGSSMRVNLLLAGADGATMWTRHYEGRFEQLFELQRRLAEGVSEQLRVTLTSAQRDRLGRQMTENVGALAAYWRGRALLERMDVPGNVSIAVTAFEEAVKLDPAFATAYAGLAEAAWASYSETKSADWVQRALDASGQAVALDSAQPQVWISRARVHRGLGRHEEALSDLEQALSLHASNDDALRLKGRLLSDMGRHEEAVAVLEEAIAVRPAYWENYDALGGALNRTGKRPDAVRAYQKVVDLQPDGVRGYFNLGVTYQQLGEADKALENFEAVLKIAPMPQAHSAVGVIQYERANYQAALASFSEAARLAPAAAPYQRNIGDAWQRLGEQAKARGAYSAAAELTRRDLEVNPNSSSLQSRLAVYLAKLGDQDEASRMVSRALAAGPRDAEVHYRAAVVHALAGRSDAALDALEQALALGSSSETARTDEDLSAVRDDPRFNEMLTPRGVGAQRRP